MLAKTPPRNIFYKILFTQNKLNKLAPMSGWHDYTRLLLCHSDCLQKNTFSYLSEKITIVLSFWSHFLSFCFGASPLSHFKRYTKEVRIRVSCLLLSSRLHPMLLFNSLLGSRLVPVWILFGWWEMGRVDGGLWGVVGSY